MVAARIRSWDGCTQVRRERMYKDPVVGRSRRRKTHGKAERLHYLVQHGGGMDEEPRVKEKRPFTMWL